MTPPSAPTLWHRPPSTIEERALEIERTEADHRVARRYAFRRYGLEYLFWFALGIGLMFWSFHTTNARYAELALWGGILVGDAGMLAVLVRLQIFSDRAGLR